jgi:hypothetical protein
MHTHTYYVLLIMAVCIYTGTLAQNTIDQRLLVTQNDGVNGGSYSIAVQVKASTLTGNNTLGSATIDVRFDPAKLTYNSNSFGDSPSGISSANGYSKIANIVENTIRFGVTSFGVNGSTARGIDLTTSYVTWATITFTIVNAAASATITINSATNQIGLFAQEANGNGTGGTGNGAILDQTLSAPIVINDVPLPVELVSFTAASDRRGTRLNWKTATETNNLGFGVERAAASLPVQTRKWAEIGFVTGAGTSAAEHNYSFMAADAPSGKSVYRLKQIDRDGRMHYSHEVEAAVAPPSTFALMQNYPNPFNPSTHIGYDVPEDCHVSIIVYDVVGRTAAVLLDEAKPAGSYMLSFDAGTLASGVYLYRMTARSGKTVFTGTKRFVLLR